MNSEKVIAIPSSISSLRLYSIYLIIATVIVMSFSRFTFPEGDEARHFLVAKSYAEGRGQIALHSPEQEPEWLTPPGYPLFLAAVFMFTGPSVVAAKIATAFTHILMAWLVLIFMRRWLPGLGPWEAFALAILGSLNVLALYFGTMVYADSLFVSFLLLAMIESIKARAKPWQGAVLVGIYAGISMLVRPVGLAMVPAGFIFYAWRRDWRSLISFLLAFGLVNLPFVIRTYLLVGQPVGHLAITDRAEGDSVHHLLAHVLPHLKTLMVLLPYYVFDALPRRFYYHLFSDRNFMAILHLGWLIKPVLMAMGCMLIAGFIRSLRGWSMATLFFLFYLVMISMYSPSLERGLVEDRYLTAIMIMGAFYMGDGLGWMAGVISRKKAVGVGFARAFWFLSALYVLLTSSAAGVARIRNESEHWGLHPWDSARYEATGNTFDLAYARVIQACEWVRDHEPTNTVLVCRVSRDAYLFSGLVSKHYHDMNRKNIATWELITEHMPERPCVIIEDAFPDSANFGGDRKRILEPALRANQEKLELIHETEEPVTRVWRVVVR